MPLGAVALGRDTKDPDRAAPGTPPRPGDPGGPSWAQPLPRAWLTRPEIDWPHSRDCRSCPTPKMGAPEGKGHIWRWGPSSQLGAW